jgi:Fe-S protein assembly co-chaperone HscB
MVGTSRSCFNCARRLGRELVACSGCHRLQPIKEGLSYFALLDAEYPPEQFEIDEAMLKLRYLSVMKQCHPDVLIAGCDGVAGQAWAAWVTRAYKCLREPVCRGKHLYGIVCRGHVDADEIGDGLSSEELMDILTKREHVEESEDRQFIQQIRSDNEGAMAADLCYLSAAFKRKDCKSIEHLLSRLRYWETLKRACEERLESLK